MRAVSYDGQVAQLMGIHTDVIVSFTFILGSALAAAAGSTGAQDLYDTTVLRTIAGEGRTVLFSSHLLDEVERVADHVTMISHGKIALSEPLDAPEGRPLCGIYFIYFVLRPSGGYVEYTTSHSDTMLFVPVVAGPRLSTLSKGILVSGLKRLLCGDATFVLVERPAVFM